jgi:enoyl-CoA hydratase/carnithine racemase
MELTDWRVIAVPPALDAASVAALRAALAGDAGIVLRGTADAFCRGLGAEPGLETLRHMAGCLLDVRLRRSPVVALVEGEALGGGLGLAAAADVVIAGPHARFGVPEALFGLLPAIIRPLLEERVLPQPLRRLILTGETIDAEEARRLGLADVVAPDVEAQLARTLRSLGRAEPGAVARWRADTFGPDRVNAVLAGTQLTASLLAAPAAIERRARFARGLAPWEDDA